MKNPIPRLPVVGALCLLALATHLSAQTSAFTYQGALSQNGQPANGTYDFMFRLLDAETDGTAAPVIPLNPGVGVTNGLFTTGINFDAENLNGANLWLEISVRTNGGGAFTTLTPRQLLTSAPYAVRAANVSAAGISGTYGNAVMFNNAANSFAGSGQGLTALNATALTQGTVPAAALNNAWKIGGNTGTTSGAHFIGTTDDQPMAIHANGLRAIFAENPGDSDDPDVFPDGAPNLVFGAPVNAIRNGYVGSTIAGGGATNHNGITYSNSISANFSSIGGGLRNQIEDDATASVISGGSFNLISTNAHYSVVVGGTDNRILQSAYYATLGGGYINTIGADAEFAVIGGGLLNVIEDKSGSATLSGGYGNRIGTNATSATIGGGVFNEIGVEAMDSVIGGGGGNTIENDAIYATIPGGTKNSAASFSFAAGRGAKAIRDGTFVWADSTDEDISSIEDNSVTFRASGGYRLFTDGSATAGVSLAPNATAWSVISDRAVKKDFAAVDGREVLEKLAAVPVQSWHYQWESADATPHLGPVAQDFKAAFYPGRDDQSITTLEFDGVALAAIQGLNQKLEAGSQESEARSQLLERRLEEELRRRDLENTELKRQNAELLKRLEAIEARIK